MTEDTLHIWTAEYLRTASRCPYWHVPNQGRRSVAWAAKLKKMGVLAGVADFCLVLDGGRAGFLELKAPKGSQRKSQRDFQASVEAAGAWYEIARTSDEVVGILKAWGAVRGSVVINDILRGAA